VLVADDWQPAAFCDHWSKYYSSRAVVYAHVATCRALVFVAKFFDSKVPSCRNPADSTYTT
jgi:hypothetical protein